MGKKAVPLKKGDEVLGCYVWCPGCKHVHFFPTSSAYYEQSNCLRSSSRKPVWSFNGNFERPTFSPSLRQYYNKPGTGEEVTTCHNFVTDGKIQFCSDCPHEFKDQTLDLEEIPADYGLPDNAER